MILIPVLCLLSAEPRATEALKAREAEIRKLVPPGTQPVSPALRKQLGEVMTQMVDLEEMAKASLGDHAASLPAAKRKQYSEVFAQRFRKVSSEQVDPFRSNAITYLPEQAADGGLIKVPTQVPLEGEQSDIVYVMRREKGGWRIEDVVIDGVSTVDNFRRAFTQIIAKEGIDSLISRLKKEAQN
jgi:phospholipid transport system substrate-binding protein